MRKAIILPILLFLISCNRNPPEIEKIKFETDYKFSSEIENEILRDTVTNPHFTGFKYQMAASDYATKGVYTNALINWDLAMGTTDKSYTQKQVDSINGIYKKVLAEEYILQKTKDYQILIINETHHNSRHRFFTKSLLKGLFDNAYRNLGLEALTNGKDKDTLLNNRGYPVQGSILKIRSLGI
ncbi:hypothetical protein K8352_12720 [Flavobacteriaceae bacterium F89]|uniref:Uncharacterized protein n=1 Tax=Cerina litoralis TaxID=2874477 RepID=A0AAE3EXX4_9FLAO|nr:hypothetical protein [Cerina litoralis]MCG2461616.1 hypothetical protein [Cerina litoralis]